MKTTAIVLVILLGGLSGCQSIPAERKNNCACNWEALPTITGGNLS